MGECIANFGYDQLRFEYWLSSEFPRNPSVVVFNDHLGSYLVSTDDEHCKEGLRRDKDAHTGPGSMIREHQDTNHPGVTHFVGMHHPTRWVRSIQLTRAR